MIVSFIRTKKQPVVSQEIMTNVGVGENKPADITPTPLTWNNAIRQLFPQDEAGRMIRICLREHRGWEGDARYALNDKNSDGSYDYGWCQVNSIHKPKDKDDSDWKRYLEDPMNHAKEVRRIYLSQGWNAWVVYSRGYVK